MERIHRLLILIQVLSILVARPISGARDGHSSVTMEMIHRHQLPGAPESNAERLRELFKSDVARQNMIARHSSHTLEVAAGIPLPSVELLMFPAADYGHVSYFVDFNVGTPFKTFPLIVDTGSDLTWVYCRYGCGQNCTDANGRYHDRRVLVGDRSSSFELIPCSSEMCRTELVALKAVETCPTPTTPCAYEYSYISAMTSGVFAHEEVVLFTANREKIRLQKVVIGCSQTSEGPFNYADGILGLGYANQSFLLSTVDKFGGKFSYCLVDHTLNRNATNYLVFGSNRSRASDLFRNKNMRYTALDVNSLRPYYMLNVIGFSLNGEFITDIPSSAWDVKQGGGVMIDSGMSLTALTTPVYGPVVRAFERELGSKYPRVDLGEAFESKFCFNRSEGFDKASQPRFMIHFGDKARFEPHLKSYFVDVVPQVTCLGFWEVPWPGQSTIGNVLQQNHLWEYDLIAQRLGFGPSTCN